MKVGRLVMVSKECQKERSYYQLFEAFLILLADRAAEEISFLDWDSFFPCNFLIFATNKKAHVCVTDQLLLL